MTHRILLSFGILVAVTTIPEYEAKSERYKLRFFSKVKIESAETALYIPRSDLFAAFGEDPSARIDDAVVPVDPPKTSSHDTHLTKEDIAALTDALK